MKRKDRTVAMNTTTPMGRSIEKEVIIKANPERVFRALTEREELERWFARTAEIDLRPGSAINLEWDRAAGIVDAASSWRSSRPGASAIPGKPSRPAPQRSPLTWPRTRVAPGCG